VTLFVEEIENFMAESGRGIFQGDMHVSLLMSFFTYIAHMF
jgi:hypothetical protein